MNPVAQLTELAVTDLGIIEHLAITIGPGMTALTGETGAGKTLVVGAIDLLLGGRADPSAVRTGATEAVVEGRFDLGDEELILTRVVPASGRSRAYINGRMVTAADLAASAGVLVELHGQHAQQTLLDPEVQRAALDRYAGIDLGPLLEARRHVRDLRAALAGLGGDEAARAREIDLLRFQQAELEDAGLSDPDEDAHLDAEEDRLGGAERHRAAAATAGSALLADRGAVDHIGDAIAAVQGSGVLSPYADRLRALQSELAELAAEVRRLGDAIEEDPARLEAIRVRRQLLVDLRRKYSGSSGSGTLGDVIDFRDAVAARLEELETHDQRAAALDRQLESASAVELEEARKVAAARREAAPRLAGEVAGHLHSLAMPAARFTVVVSDDDGGEHVTYRLAANPGSADGPLAKVASGGELARTMLALRLVVSDAPGVMIFDEVDTGVGGEAALAVGAALASLGTAHQVLVVTHLPQVAAFAHAQVRISKSSDDGATRSSAEPLDADARVIELSRMLSGTPENQSVQIAAGELLALAADRRDRT